MDEGFVFQFIPTEQFGGAVKIQTHFQKKDVLLKSMDIIVVDVYFETSTTDYQSTRRNIVEDLNFYAYSKNCSQKYL
jgi:hypothetical protein